MNHAGKQRYDVVNEVLEACVMAYPVSSFIIGLYKQYQQRGSLSKKQLEGLLVKASGIDDIAPAKLATLEALIKKMPTRDKTKPSAPTPLYEKDEATGNIIRDILVRFPQHKRVLFLQSKYINNQPLSPTEQAELKRFAQLLKR